MVSADGPRPELNPDEPDSGSGETPDQTADSGVAQRGTLTDSRSTQRESGSKKNHPNSKDSEQAKSHGTTAATDGQAVAEKKPKKQPKVSRKRKRINRLVMEFQPDAVEMEHRKVAGGLRWTLYTVIALLISAITWATWARVDRIVIGEGKLISTEKSIVIQPSMTSPVRSIEADFGQRVKAGDVLVRLDPTFSEADVKKLESQLNNSTARLLRLTAQQQKLESFDISQHQMDPVWQTELKVFLDKQNEMSAKTQEFAAEHRKLIAQQNRNQGEIRDLSVRYGLRQKLLKTEERLHEKGTSTTAALYDSQIQTSFVLQQLNTAKNAEIETEAEMDALEKRKLSFMAGQQAEISSELADTRAQHVTVVEELNKARRSEELSVLVCPGVIGVDEFIVLEVAERSVGSVVQPGDPLVRLTRVGASLEVEVKIKVKDIARIRESVAGKPKDAQVKLSSFPYMKHGKLEGQIRAISEDAFEEGQPPMTEAFYKVRIHIIDWTLVEVPENNKLMPGMAATAEIKVGTRRVIDYFLYPIWRSLEGSIREP